MKSRLTIVLLVAVILGSVGFLVTIWRSGAPLPETGLAAELPGTLYYLKRDYQDQLIKLYRQPANLAAPPELVVSRSGCGESNCNIAGFQFTADGEIEYTAMHGGEWYLFRGDQPVQPGMIERGEPTGARSERGSLMVNGEVVLPYAGAYDGAWASGYQPIAWGPGGRYLVFYYSGYRFGPFGMLGDVTGLGRAHASNYVLDLATGAIVRYPRVHWMEWVE